MFLTIDQCTAQNCGKKAYALAVLARQGFHVPSFVVIGFDEAPAIAGMKEISDVDAARIQAAVGDGPYAVRSALSGEDGSTSSMAGQFITVLNVEAKNLLATIKEVIAENMRRAPQMKQSIIVQRSLAPEKSGVVFTRSPFDPFCIQIDEVNGYGEELVSGRSNSTTVYVARTMIEQATPLAKIAREIETLFGHPQDIEWSIEKGELFILQARPITTLTSQEAKALDHIERVLPKTPYEFVQNGFSELAPSAEPQMVALLGSLFEKGGPVEKAYSRFGIKGEVLNPITVIGDTVFSDTEKEQSLFQKGFRAFLNQVAFSSAKKKYKQTIVELKEKITTFRYPEVKSSPEARAFVLQEYETVFAANVIASSLEASARFGLKKLAPSTAAEFKLSSEESIAPPMMIVGNGFSIYDQTVFHPRLFLPMDPGESSARSVAETYQYQAFQADVIREYGRWYAIQLMNVLRKAFQAYEPENVKAPEIQRAVVLPRLLSTAATRINVNEMLSTGEAVGTLAREDALQATNDPILFTEKLTPDLAQYLPKIKGVVTTVGSSLSHFAILARELGIPVLRITRLPEGYLGKKVKMVDETLILL